VYDFRIKFTGNTTESPELYVLQSKKYYSPTSLYKKTVKDENWTSTDGNNKTTVEFMDMQGRVILTRKYNEGQKHDTYYVYDDYGNLTYVIPPLASDKIVKETFLLAATPINFSWTKLVEVDANLAEAYDRKMESYENEDILNVDLLSEYNGAGGFAISADTNGNLTLNINITSSTAMPYRNGIIADLSSLGQFSDQELGRLKGSGYEYYFLVDNNQLKVSGSGYVPGIIQSFTGNTQLDYQKKYSWAELVDGDASELQRYLGEVHKLNEDEILTANIQNYYGGIGGAGITFAPDDTFTLSVNINATLQPVSFKDGAVFTLDVQRPIPDGYLGEISGQGYSYRFNVSNNMLTINGSGQFTNLTFTATKGTLPINTDAERLCYIYHYDNRNRVVEKHIPDNDWTYIMYDKLDRPVLTQSVNQRNDGAVQKWLFTKYDKFDRIAYLGEYSTTISSRAEIQNQVNMYELSESKSVTSFAFDGASIYYTNNVFPKILNEVEILMINYYDDYNFDRKLLEAGFGSSDWMPTSSWYGNYSDKNKGLATGSVVRVLDNGTDAPGNNWITSFTRYDEKARPMWMWSYNKYLNAWNSVEIYSDFMGKTLATKSRNKTGNSAMLTRWDFFSYDQIGRPLQHTQTIGNDENGNRELISWNSYTDLGDLKQKKVGGRFTSGATYAAFNALQKIDYSKNIRGWLTGINDNGVDVTSSDDLFAFGLDYSGLYNGNISATSWNSKVDNESRNYSYYYDDLNRLKNATYNSSNPDEQYHERGISYDKNGNIMSLERWGSKEPGQFDKIDELVYDYKPMSNQLMGIDDSASDFGYKDYNKTENDYDYDLAGNMELDKNKRIRLIKYNHLNLPTEVGKDNGSTIAYIYDAAGTKIEKKVTNGSITTTKYSYGFVYENDVLQYFPTSEGYVKNENGTFSYVYQYKDHLGNVRLSYSDLDKDGAINDVPGFSDGFETGSGWTAGFGESIVLDSTIKRTGNYSAKLVCNNNISSYRESDYRIDINNAVATEYTFSAWVQGSGQGQITLLMLPVVDANYYSTALPTEFGAGWRLITKTILVPARTRQLIIRVDIVGNGQVWFDDVSLKKTNGASEIVDHTDYYPFGMEHGNTTVMSGGNPAAQKIGYNGKEYEEGIDYNMNEMDWRHYDPAIGRFNCVDKLAESTCKISPYAFSANNPVIFADPSGLLAMSSSDYNWETGTYASGSVDAAMAKVGAEYVDVDADSAELIYQQMFESLFSGNDSGGGGNGDGGGIGGFFKSIWQGIFGKKWVRTVTFEDSPLAIPADGGPLLKDPISELTDEYGVLEFTTLFKHGPFFDIGMKNLGSISAGFVNEEGYIYTKDGKKRVFNQKIILGASKEAGWLFTYNLREKELSASVGAYTYCIEITSKGNFFIGSNPSLSIGAGVGFEAGVKMGYQFNIADIWDSFF
jgi:RHS repeat-associated protein